MTACMGQMVGTEECWELTGRVQQRQEGDGGGDLPDDGADLILDGLDGLIPGSSGRDTTSQSTDQQESSDTQLTFNTFTRPPSTRPS